MSVSSSTPPRHRVLEFVQAARECVGAFGHGASSPACSTITTIVAATELVTTLATAPTGSSMALSFGLAAFATVTSAFAAASIKEGASTPSFTKKPEVSAYRLGITLPTVVGVATAALTKYML